MVVSQWSNPESEPILLRFPGWKTDQEFPAPRRTTVLSPATYPSRAWGRRQNSPPSSQEGSQRVAAAVQQSNLNPARSTSLPWTLPIRVSRMVPGGGHVSTLP